MLNYDRAASWGSLAAAACSADDPRHGARAGAGPEENIFTLDTCSCVVTLQELAVQLRPALETATAVSNGAGHGTGSRTSTPSPAPPDMLDLAGPLICPAPGCGRWLSSRDVRLLLGPHGTQALYRAIYAALLRHGDRVASASATGKARLGSNKSRLSASRAGLERNLRSSPAPKPSPDAVAGRTSVGAGGLAGSGGGGSSTATLPTASASVTSRGPSRGLLRQLWAALRGALARRGRRQRRGAGCCLRGPPGTSEAATAAGASRGEEEEAARTLPAELQCMADQAHRVLKLLRRVRAVLLSAQEEDDEEEGQEEGEGEGGGGKGATGAGPSGSGRGARAAPAPAACTGVQTPAPCPPRQRATDGAAGASGSGASGDGGGSSAGGAGANGSGGRAGAWPKGVGYGGIHCRSGGEGEGGRLRAVQAAQERQGRADAKVGKCLSALMQTLSCPAAAAAGGGASASDGRASGSGSGATASTTSASGGGGDTATSGHGLGLSPPPVLHAALHYGGLPYVLRLLLQNDSLLDMGARAELYRAAMEVVRALMSSMSLLELLEVPATDPRDRDSNAAPQGALRRGAAATAAPRAGDGSGSCATCDRTCGSGGGSGSGCPCAGSSPAVDAPSLGSLFPQLRRQCAIFARSAEALVDGTPEDAAALGLVLELGSLAEEVEAAVAQWGDSMGEAPGALHGYLALPAPEPAPGAAAAAACAAAAAAEEDIRGWSGTSPACPGAAAVAAAVGGRSAGAAAGGAAAGDAADAAAAASSLVSRRSEYMSVMKALQFREVRLLDDHYFRREVHGSSGSSASAGGELMRTRLKRITGEISGLASGLPLDWEAAAFVAVDDARVDVLRALLLPASDTPYANGPFIFDILLPPDYPTRPPKVQFLTTGGGKVRFNPNLYAEGKVCLSLLGTWSGPSWDPTMSTILQVLVSIQSMILVSDPYYNEPGWEARAGTAAGRKASSDYNARQRLNTLTHSILPALQLATQPPKQEQPSSLAGPSSINSDPGGDPVPGLLTGGSTFRQVLRNHYRLKRGELLRQCDEWAREARVSSGGDLAAKTSAAVLQVRALLKKL